VLVDGNTSRTDRPLSLLPHQVKMLGRGAGGSEQSLEGQSTGAGAKTPPSLDGALEQNQCAAGGSRTRAHSVPGTSRLPSSHRTPSHPKFQAAEKTSEGAGPTVVYLHAGPTAVCLHTAL
jgi:hypothetical protein